MYLIHTCPEREWYVNKYLVPSMKEQGIDPSNILIYSDKNGDGNLLSCVNSFMSIGLNRVGNTWHLQDDVIISHDFKSITEKYLKEFNGIVCGMKVNIEEEKDKPKGLVKAEDMWYSFQCIMLPNIIALKFAQWFYQDVYTNPQYRMYVHRKKYDDTLFRIFMLDYKDDIQILNLYPNIVDHVDYILGGSIINSEFPHERRAAYFNDKYLVEELEQNFKAENIITSLQEQIERLNNGNKRSTDFSRFDGHLNRFKSPDNYNGAE